MVVKHCRSQQQVVAEDEGKVAGGLEDVAAVEAAEGH